MQTKDSTQTETSESALTGISISLNELIQCQHHAKDLNFNFHKRVLTTQTGGHMSKIKGRGIDFAEVRNYQAGDDIRLMDWRVTARTGTPHTKVFNEEKERPVFLIVDQSASMLFGTKVAFKSVIAAKVAAILAWAAVKQGDRVGSFVYSGNRHIELKPRSRQQGVLPLLKILSETDPLAEPAYEHEQFEKILISLRRVARPGSMIFFISDFKNLNDSIQKQMYLLSRHCELTACLIYDQLERTAPPPDQYAICDGSKALKINTNNKVFRQEYNAYFLEQFNQIQKCFLNLGVPLLEISTEQDVAMTLRQYFSNKVK